MGQRERSWLLAELPGWVSEGIMDAATAECLRQRYAAGPASGRPWGVIACGVLGALLIGAGVILLLAHNWGGLPRQARAVLAFAPLVSVQALAAWGLVRGWSGTAWRETIGILWALAIGACIALIGQTYHLSDDAEAFLLSWAILALPVCWITRSTGVLVIVLALAVSWAACTRLADGVALLFWPITAALLPVVLGAARRNAYGHDTVLMLWCVALACTAAVGITLEKVMPGLWMVIYAGLFGVLYLTGGYWGAEAPTFWQRPLHVVGSFGTVGLLYLLSFRWPWDEIGWNHLRDGAGYHLWAAAFDYALALALPVAAVSLLVTAVRRGQARRMVFGLLPLVVAVSYLLAARRPDHSGGADLVCSVHLFVLGLAVLIQGIIARRAGTVNAGMLVLIALILTRFFDTDASFIVKGIVAIALGVMFLTTNLLLARRRREVQP